MKSTDLFSCGLIRHLHHIFLLPAAAPEGSYLMLLVVRGGGSHDAFAFAANTEEHSTSSKLVRQQVAQNGCSNKKKHDIKDPLASAFDKAKIHQIHRFD